MTKKLVSFLLPALVLMFTGFSFQSVNAQTSSSPFSFRAGQSIYIVAFRRVYQPVSGDVSTGNSVGAYQNEYALDAEQKVRKEIVKWRYFRVVDKLSEADFVLLVNSEYSSMEALAIPHEAYRQRFKEKYDMDTLRESAFGRFLAGPLKIPTLSRLSERLIKQFREKVEDVKSSDKK